MPSVTKTDFYIVTVYGGNCEYVFGATPLESKPIECRIAAHPIGEGRLKVESVEVRGRLDHDLNSHELKSLAQVVRVALAAQLHREIADFSGGRILARAGNTWRGIKT